MSTTTQPTTTFPTVTIHVDTGSQFEVPAEATEVPGLYVTPDVVLADPPLFRNGWRLTHGPSGVSMPYRGPSPAHVRELARALAAVTDWAALPADTAVWPAGLVQQIHRVGAAWEMRRHRRQCSTFWPVHEEAAS